MTFDSVVDQCWADLPAIRKRIVGRAAVRQMIADTVAEWDAEAIGACTGETELAAYRERIVGRIKARREEYGFVLASILLTAVLVAVVEWVVKWWLDRNIHRVLIAGWHREMRP